MPKRPANDPHFTWSEGDVTFSIPTQPNEEPVVPKTNPLQPEATQAEREMYRRYVRYFDSGTSPYAGPAPLPFFLWMRLPAQQRPGGPE